MLLGHGQLVVRQHPQVPLHRAAFQQVSPWPVLVHGVVPPQVQDIVNSLVNITLAKMHAVFLAFSKSQNENECLVNTKGLTKVEDRWCFSQHSFAAKELKIKVAVLSGALV